MIRSLTFDSFESTYCCTNLRFPYLYPINSSESLRQLNFPTYDFKIRRDKDQVFIFDEVRKKWVVLTPEEWVRQHVVSFLVNEKNYPSGLVGVEKSIKVNGRSKRFDIVCYSPGFEPIILVECKAPEVAVSQKTLDQILRYNSEIQAKYLLLTNGIQTVCAYIDYESKNMTYLQEIPSYKI